MNEKVRDIFNSHTFRLVMVLMAYTVFLIIWSILEPFNGCNDESMRYDIPKFIFENNRLPSLFDTSIYSKYYGFSYASNPNMPLILMGVFVKLAHILGVPEGKLFFIARGVNIAIGVLFAITVLQIGKCLFENIYARRMFAICLILLPEICFLFTYVNCDAMALLGTSISFLFSIKGLKEEWSLRNCLGLILGCTMIMTSYYFAYPVLVSVAIIFVLSFLKNDRRNLKKLCSKGIFVFLGSLILPMFFWIRNYLLYGSIMGGNITKKISLLYGVKEFSIESRANHAYAMMHSFKGFLGFFKGSLFGLFGVFGWTNIKYPTFLYYIVLILAVMLAVCGLVYIWQKRKKYTTILMVGFGVCVVVNVLLSMYFSTYKDYQPQGRYIIYTAIPVSYWVVNGILYLIDKLNTKLQVAYSILLVLFLVMDIIAVTIVGLSY